MRSLHLLSVNATSLLVCNKSEITLPNIYSHFSLLFLWPNGVLATIFLSKVMSYLGLIASITQEVFCVEKIYMTLRALMTSWVISI